MQIFYVVEDWDPECFYECETQNIGVDRWTAQDCAENAFHEHDGWESSWPLTISLFESPYKEGYKATFTCDVEPIPHFYASQTERPNGHASRD